MFSCQVAYEKPKQQLESAAAAAAAAAKEEEEDGGGMSLEDLMSQMKNL